MVRQHVACFLKHSLAKYVSQFWFRYRHKSAQAPGTKRFGSFCISFRGNYYILLDTISADSHAMICPGHCKTSKHHPYMLPLLIMLTPFAISPDIIHIHPVPSNTKIPTSPSTYAHSNPTKEHYNSSRFEIT